MWDKFQTEFILGFNAKMLQKSVSVKWFSGGK